MRLGTHFDAITQEGSKLNQFGIFFFVNNKIDRCRDVGFVLTLNNINHTNCFGYIWVEVEKMSNVRSFVANI